MKWMRTKDYVPSYGELVLVYRIPGIYEKQDEKYSIFLARRKEVVSEKKSTDKKVKITIEDRYYEQLQSNSGSGYSFRSEEITHWMELPEKPE